MRPRINRRIHVAIAVEIPAVFDAAWMAPDGRAAVVATLNPAGMDLERWREQGIDEAFATSQLKVVDAYRRPKQAYGTVQRAFKALRGLSE